MEKNVKNKSIKLFCFYMSLISFLAFIFMLLIDLPFGLFYDLLMFVVVLVFLGSSTTSIILNGFHLISKTKPVNIIQIVIPILLLLCLIIYVLKVINEDYPN